MRQASEITAAGAYRPRVGGARDTVDGKLVLQRRLPAAAVTFDPSTFQFKSGGDHRGVTDRLHGVQSWNPLAAGKTMVFEYRDGRRVIADGHQRTGLAQRLMAAGHAPIKLNAFVLREMDGWRPGDVRAYAAIKNMHESSGQSLDMAKVMRERPDLVAKAALPVTDYRLREARSLARLSPAAFDMVAGGAVKPEVAAAVGDAFRDGARHADVLQELVQAKVATGQHARLYVDQIKSAAQINETTSSLFGEETTQRSLLRERAAVLDRALNQLKSDKRIFGLLDREANTIQEAGNKLATGANVERARSAGQMATLVEKLATTRGPISTLLDDAAKTVAEGASPSKAARQFVSGLKTAAKDGGGITKLATAADIRMPLPTRLSEGVGTGSLFSVLAPLGIVAAGAIAFDAASSQAKAAGRRDATAQGMGAGLIAGGGVAATGYAISKGLGAIARLAPRVAPLLGPAALAVAAAGMAYGAVQGYRKSGTVAGALLGSVSGGEVLERMKIKPPVREASPVRSYTRTYKSGPKAGLTETVMVN